MIKDHSDHIASKQPVNPRWSWIHQFSPLTHNDLSYRGSLMLIRIITKERMLGSLRFILYGDLLLTAFVEYPVRQVK